ncbi:glycosyltransferase family 4 protein [Deferrisoma sp.]
MHLLIIHQAFVGPNEPGGTRHYEFARRLVRQGHTVTIVASDLSYLTGGKIVDRGGLVSEQEVDGIRILRAYTYPSLHKSFVWRVVSFLSFMCTSVVAGLRAGKVDVVMGTSPPIFQAVSAWFVAALRRRPFLLEIRDLWPEFAVDMGVLKNRLLISLARWLELFLYGRASHIVVNSPAYRDYLKEKRIRVGKISLIPNGVDPEMFRPEDHGAAFRTEFGLDGKFVVTYAGALGLANDIWTILRAADLLRGDDRIRFVLVGDGKERPALEAFAAEQNLNNVIFAGPRPKAEIPTVLAASDACVATLKDIPMFRTTYPNKVFDYMAAGRPTILAIDGVIREVVEAARGGVFVPPGDPESLAQVVRRFVDNPAEAREMGTNAREFVARQFNRATHAGEFLRLVERLV